MTMQQILTSTAMVLSLAAGGALAQSDKEKKQAEVRKVAEATLDLKAAQDRKERVVRKNLMGTESLLKKNKVTTIKGAGTLVAPDRIQVAGGPEAGEVEAGAVILATGSVPRQDPFSFTATRASARSSRPFIAAISDSPDYRCDHRSGPWQGYCGVIPTSCTILR